MRNTEEDRGSEHWSKNGRAQVREVKRPRRKNANRASGQDGKRQIGLKVKEEKAN